mgnify:CR=1 FL=1
MESVRRIGEQKWRHLRTLPIPHDVVEIVFVEGIAIGIHFRDRSGAGITGVPANAVGAAKVTTANAKMMLAIRCIKNNI